MSWQQHVPQSITSTLLHLHNLHTLHLFWFVDTLPPHIQNIPVFLFLPMHRREMLVCCLSAVLSSVLSFCTTVRYLKKKRKNYFFVIWSHFHPWLRELFIRLPQNQKTRFLWESAEWENTQIRAQSIRTNLLFSSTLSRSHTKRKLEHIKDGSRVLWSQSIKASVLFHPASTLWFSDVSVRYPDWLNVCVWRTCSVCGLHLLLTCLCVFFCQTRVSHSQARPQPPSPPNPPHPVRTSHLRRPRRHVLYPGWSILFHCTSLPAGRSLMTLVWCLIFAFLCLLATSRQKQDGVHHQGLKLIG